MSGRLEIQKNLDCSNTRDYSFDLLYFEDAPDSDSANLAFGTRSMASAGDWAVASEAWLLFFYYHEEILQNVKPGGLIGLIGGFLPNSDTLLF